MRITPSQIETILSTVRDTAGEESVVRLFGSRLDDSQRGGDIDLLIELPHPVENPALLSARLAGRLMRVLGGRRVDVVLTAPNLMPLPIHEMARLNGVAL